MALKMFYNLYDIISPPPPTLCLTYFTVPPVHIHEYTYIFVSNIRYNFVIKPN